MSEWSDCSKCGTPRENQCGCPNIFCPDGLDPSDGPPGRPWLNQNTEEAMRAAFANPNAVTATVATETAHPAPDLDMLEKTAREMRTMELTKKRGPDYVVENEGRLTLVELPAPESIVDWVKVFGYPRGSIVVTPLAFERISREFERESVIVYSELPLPAGHAIFQGIPLYRVCAVDLAILKMRIMAATAGQLKFSIEP